MRQIKVYSGAGDSPVLEYNPATADMREVNEYVDNLEKKMNGLAFEEATGEQVKEITRETGDVTILYPMAGG